MLFQCFGMLQVREKDFTAQMIWWYCAVAHLRGNIGYILVLTLLGYTYFHVYFISLFHCSQ